MKEVAGVSITTIVAVVIAVCIVVFLYLRISKTAKENHGPAQEHPVLRYGREASERQVPATIGDPLRPPPSAGPLDSGGMYGQDVWHNRGYSHGQAYSASFPGPMVGVPQGVPVPAGALKSTSEKYKVPFYEAYLNRARAALLGGGVLTAGPGAEIVVPSPYGEGIARGIAPTPSGPAVVSGPVSTGFDNLNSRVGPNGFFNPYGPNPFLGGGPGGSIPFFSSVDSFAPLPEIRTPWEKVGLLTSNEGGKDSILNLYRRPIAPLQDLFEYSVQDKNGFIIELASTRYLEDGDVVNHVDGKAGKGPWKVRIYVNDKWVWQ